MFPKNRLCKLWCNIYCSFWAVLGRTHTKAVQGFRAGCFLDCHGEEQVEFTLNPYNIYCPSWKCGTMTAAQVDQTWIYHLVVQKTKGVRAVSDNMPALRAAVLPITKKRIYPIVSRPSQYLWRKNGQNLSQVFSVFWNDIINTYIDIYICIHLQIQFRVSLQICNKLQKATGLQRRFAENCIFVRCWENSFWL